MVKTRSLSHLGLVRHRVVTDIRTDRIPIANTVHATAVPAGTAVARKKVSEILPIPIQYCNIKIPVSSVFPTTPIFSSILCTVCRGVEQTSRSVS